MKFQLGKPHFLWSQHLVITMNFVILEKLTTSEMTEFILKQYIYIYIYDIYVYIYIYMYDKIVYGNKIRIWF